MSLSHDTHFLPNVVAGDAGPVPVRRYCVTLTNIQSRIGLEINVESKLGPYDTTIAIAIDFDTYTDSESVVFITLVSCESCDSSRSSVILDCAPWLSLSWKTSYSLKLILLLLMSSLQR